ncbi:MAG: VCBS repeat-containing protein, partial [Coleofasciculaceae cyanobacterium SM2_3_26]|nr:VCBS repeat-containing protein [Coleofasciculaceae cyanobacterium SM2_3_26]
VRRRRCQVNDGFADLLWHHQPTGSNAAWLMHGLVPVAPISLAPPSGENGWQIATTADFDSDGRSDMLWRNQATGDNAIQLDVAGKGAIAPLPSFPFQTWQIRGTGDFNGDAQADILWHNTVTGAAMAWVMAGATPSHTLFLPQTPGANAEPVSLYDRNTFGQQTTPHRFDIEFDYRFDTKGFFSDPVRRATLEAAADFWEATIQDEFPNVAAGNTFGVIHPETGQWERATLTADVDDLLIFVGAQTTPFNYPQPALARGGPGGFDATDALLKQRLWGADCEPWMGQISFDLSPAYASGMAGSWFFDPTPHTRNDIPIGQFDFFSVALHEITRVLGFGNSPAYLALIRDRRFTGATTTAANGGIPVALDSTLTLIQENTLTGAIARC